MENNDILVRVKNALDLNNADIVEIFKLGGIEITKEEIEKIGILPEDSHQQDDPIEENTETIECNNIMLESFLNGLIIFKRGKQDLKPGQPERPPLSIKDNGSVNNVLLKKMKIALSLESQDMFDIFEEAGVEISKGELSSIFRKEGQKNYKKCSDQYAMDFLKGLALKYWE